MHNMTIIIHARHTTKQVYIDIFYPESQQEFSLQLSYVAKYVCSYVHIVPEYLQYI